MCQIVAFQQDTWSSSCLLAVRSFRILTFWLGFQWTDNFKPTSWTHCCYNTVAFLSGSFLCSPLYLLSPTHTTSFSIFIFIHGTIQTYSTAYKQLKKKTAHRFVHTFISSVTHTVNSLTTSCILPTLCLYQSIAFF